MLELLELEEELGEELCEEGEDDEEALLEEPELGREEDRAELLEGLLLELALEGREDGILEEEGLFGEVGGTLLGEDGGALLLFEL